MIILCLAASKKESDVMNASVKDYLDDQEVMCVSL